MRTYVVRRRLQNPELRMCGWLSLLALVLTVFAALQQHWIVWFPLAALSIPLLLGALLLGPRTLPWFVVFVMLLLVVAASRRLVIDANQAAAIVVYFVLGLLVLLVSYRRSRLGVAGMRGESMLVDLRDRILRQGGIPALPAAWVAESAMASAGGTRFSGDFVLAVRTGDDRLEVVVVDVSGKGEQAGTRALLLSGALGGLLGAVPPAAFLPAANAYLIRQGWEEGFATAIHLSLDLGSGRYEVRAAGHPPALLRPAPTEPWLSLESGGPALGLIDEATYDAALGMIGPGGLMLLYTDGMVEEPGHEIEAGVEQLIAAADRITSTGLSGSARELVEARGIRNDDRSAVVIGRAGQLG
ncbi:MAG: PP2C family protein-serine/threonine phosphatase [Nocardioides sp.]|uniref:PP2C family protein-serine/threonine phosphatase n=1 Tax=Nocardioides sp. TaxID=35761 RepID=UPI0039E33746